MCNVPEVSPDCVVADIEIRGQRVHELALSPIKHVGVPRDKGRNVMLKLEQAQHAGQSGSSPTDPRVRFGSSPLGAAGPGPQRADSLPECHAGRLGLVLEKCREVKRVTAVPHMTEHRGQVITGSPGCSGIGRYGPLSPLSRQRMQNLPMPWRSHPGLNQPGYRARVAGCHRW